MMSNGMLRELIKARLLNTESYLENHLSKTARDLVQLLEHLKTHVVFAESCTHGEVSVAMGKYPGATEYFCGSMITYRDAEKTEWLGIGKVGIRLWSSVCAPVACQMARNLLSKTPEADYAASVTGHLGPDASLCTDGVVFIGLAWREAGEVKLYRVVEEYLVEKDRDCRRKEAAELVLQNLTKCIQATHSKAATEGNKSLREIA